MADTFLKPPEILAPLGRFDLDPCAPINRPWDTAEHLNKGAAQAWLRYLFSLEPAAKQEE